MRSSRVVSNGDPAHGHRATGRGWVGFLAHRWPTAVGIAVPASIVFDLTVDADLVSLLSEITAVMALVYVGAAALDRRWTAWLVVLAAVPASLIPSTSWANPTVALLVTAAVFVVFGAVRGLLRRPGGLSLQTAGMVVFGAVALAALYVDLELGAYLMAFALLGHAGWDAYHYIRDRVVARSYAEFCGINDLLLGVAILLYLA